MSYVGRPSSTQALQSGRDLCPAGADFFGTIAIFWTSSKVLGDRQAKGLLRPHKDLAFQQSRCEFSLVKTLPQAMEHGALAVSLFEYPWVTNARISTSLAVSLSRLLAARES